MPPDPPHDTRVTVVIITRNRRAELGRTLGKLAELPEHPAVIVVDNGSDDGTAAHVRWDHPDVQLIAARSNLGAVGRNLALRRVTTPYAAFCDDDTWWEPGALTLAADALDAHPDVASVTARIVVEPDGTATPLWLVGPIAVSPERRGEGIARAMLRRALSAIDGTGIPAVLIGDPEYYGPFGFAADATSGWSLPGPFERHRLLARLDDGQTLPGEGMLGPRR